MIVRTAQDFNLINCGCCAIGLCESPRLSCESITIKPCGYQLPNLSLVSVEDRCKKFATYKTYLLDQITQDITNGTNHFTGETTYDYKTTSRVFFTTLSGLSGSWTYECDTRLEDTTRRIYSDAHETEDGEDTIWWTNEYNSVGSLTECTGTQVYTDKLVPANSYTEPHNECNPVYPPSPNDSFSYVPNTFTLTQNVIIDEYTDQILIYQHEYTDLIDSTWLSEKMDEIGFDKKNGTDCSSSIISISGCETPSEATKARYKVGIPLSYTTTLSALSGGRTSTYILQWDEVFFPSLSTNPPVSVASREWTWGGDINNGWSEWFIIPLPSEGGETRVVNMMIQCYKDSRVGVKPTSSGEIVDI